MENFFSNNLSFNLGANLDIPSFDNIYLLSDFSQNMLDHSQYDFFPIELPTQQINLPTMFDYNSGKQFLYNFNLNSTNTLPSINKSFFQNKATNTSFSVSSGSINTVTSASSTNAVSDTTKTSSTSNGKRISRNMQWWLAQGYNPEKGKRLCQATKRHLDSNPKQADGKRKIRGQCVGFVRRGINDAFYGGIQHYSAFERACTCGEKYLSKDPNFKKITGIDLASVIPSEIPEGAVIIYHQGYSNSAASQIAGHGEVSNGQGMGYSDCLTYLKNNNKQRIKEIWIPV